jgi:Icc-related predicted phosphoesterase
MDFTALSDTHNRHHQIDLPFSPLVIFAGDALNLFAAQDPSGVLDEAALWVQLEDFADWLNARALEAVFVPGNHDLVFEIDPERARKILGPKVHVLIDESVTIGGIHIHGSPWQPIFMQGHAFTLERGPALAAKWALIPQDTDLLVTHSPPLGFGDFNGTSHQGDADLTQALTYRVHPALHVFGHIHGDWLPGAIGVTSCVNASSFDAAWVPRSPFVLGLESRSIDTPGLP